MKKFKIFAISLLSLACVIGVVGCKNNELPEEKRVQLVSDNVKSYILEKKPISDFKFAVGDKQNIYDINLDTEGIYNFTLSLDKNFNNGIDKTIRGNKVQITNLLVDTKYYWKAISNSNSFSGEFVTQSYSPRFMNVQGVNNVRDLGGGKNNNIAQGIIYRGSEMNTNYVIDENGIEVMKNSMKIKLDLDLRNKTETSNITESPLGREVKYINIPSFEGYLGVTKEAQKENYKEVFKALADASNYPIYFHCFQGADRTGTIACLIEGLMGMGDEARLIDYNLTSFSSGIESYRDGASSSFKYSFIEKNLSLLYGEKTFEATVNRYLKEYIGLTSDEIKLIKENLSGKNMRNMTQSDIAYIL